MVVTPPPNAAWALVQLEKLEPKHEFIQLTLYPLFSCCDRNTSFSVVFQSGWFSSVPLSVSRFFLLFALIPLGQHTFPTVDSDMVNDDKETMRALYKSAPGTSFLHTATLSRRACMQSVVYRQSPLKSPLANIRGYHRRCDNKSLVWPWLFSTRGFSSSCDIPHDICSAACGCDVSIGMVSARGNTDSFGCGSAEI